MNEKRDDTYYLKLMRQRAQIIYDELTEGKSIRKQMAMQDELEERTFMPRLEAEIARCLPEARAIVEKLESAGSKPVDLVWVMTNEGQ